MANNTWRLVALLGLLVAGSSLAQERAPAGPSTAAAAPHAEPADARPPEAGVATFGDLDRIQSQILMMQAQLKLIQAQDALAKAEGTTPTGASSATPVVAGVFGTEARPYARFLLGNGAEATGRPGDVLPGDFRVVYVGVDKVVIKDRKGHMITANFSSSAPPTSDARSVPARAGTARASEG